MRAGEKTMLRLHTLEATGDSPTKPTVRVRVIDRVQGLGFRVYIRVRVRVRV